MTDRELVKYARAGTYVTQHVRMREQLADALDAALNREKRLRSAAEHLSRTAKQRIQMWDDYDRPRGVKWFVSDAAMRGLRASLEDK